MMRRRVSLCRDWIRLVLKHDRLIWGLCGTGFFLDVMWAQSFGLVLSNIQREFGFSDKEFGNLYPTFAGGAAVGAFTWGILVDVVGALPIFSTCLHSTQIMLNN